MFWVKLYPDSVVASEPPWRKKLSHASSIVYIFGNFAFCNLRRPDVHLMTYFSAVEETNRHQNYHVLPFAMIVMILTTS